MFPHISTELLINTLYPGLILGSFYYGYVITQLPGGWLGSQFGAKYLFGFGVLLTSVVTMFTPAAAHHSVGMLLLVRVVEGCGQVKVFSVLSVFSANGPFSRMYMYTNLFLLNYWRCDLPQKVFLTGDTLYISHLQRSSGSTISFSKSLMILMIILKINCPCT